MNSEVLCNNLEKMRSEFLVKGDIIPNSLTAPLISFSIINNTEKGNYLIDN